MNTKQTIPPEYALVVQPPIANNPIIALAVAGHFTGQDANGLHFLDANRVRWTLNVPVHGIVTVWRRSVLGKQAFVRVTDWRADDNDMLAELLPPEVFKTQRKSASEPHCKMCGDTGLVRPRDAENTSDMVGCPVCNPDPMQDAVLPF